MKRIVFVSLALISLVLLIGVTGCVNVLSETEVGKTEGKAQQIFGNSWRTKVENFDELFGKRQIQTFKILLKSVIGKVRESITLGKIEFNQIQDLTGISGNAYGLYRNCLITLEVRDAVDSNGKGLLASCTATIPDNCLNADCTQIEENPKPKWFGCQPVDSNGNKIQLSIGKYYHFGIKYNPACRYRLKHHIGGDGVPDTQGYGSDDNGETWGSLLENEEYVRLWDWNAASNALGSVMYSHDSVFENGDFERGDTSSWAENPSYNLGKIDVVEILTGPELKAEWDITNGCKLSGNSLSLNLYTGDFDSDSWTLADLSSYLNTDLFVNSWIKLEEGTNIVFIDCRTTGGSDVYYSSAKIRIPRNGKQFEINDIVVSALPVMGNKWTVAIAKKINAGVKEGKYSLKLLRDTSYIEGGNQRIQVEQDEEVSSDYDYYLDAWTYADTNIVNGTAMGLVLTTGTTQSQTWQNNDAVYLVTYADEYMAHALCDTYLNFVCVNRLGTGEGMIGTALVTEDGIELTKDTGYIKGKWIHVDDMPLDELFYQNITYQPFHISFCFRPDIGCVQEPPPVTILANGLQDTLRVKPAMGSLDGYTTGENYTAAFFDNINICAVLKGTKPTGDICGN